MDERKALDKIKKCMAMASSEANPYEAANAWRQAHALMRRHNLEHTDVLASEIREVHVKGGTAQRPEQWVPVLVSSIEMSFDCVALNRWTRFPKKQSIWIFLGKRSKAEVAGYSFEVLFKQITAGRKKHLARYCQSMSLAEKRRHGALFCLAWTCNLHDRIKEFAQENADKAAIDAYIEKSLNVSGNMQSREMKGLDELDERERFAVAHGLQAAKDTRLHHGVDGAGPALLAGNVRGTV